MRPRGRSGEQAAVGAKPKRRVKGAADAVPLRATFKRQTAASAIPRARRTAGI